MGRLLVTILAALLACAGPPRAAARSVPLDHLPALRGGYFRLDSRVVGRPFHIYVRLPADYAAEPARTYPVVYLLDGDSLFPIIAPTHLFLNIDDKMPEAIVVGIAYGSFAKPINNRHVDFMPAGPDVKPGESRIGEFHNFLERELIPQVESRYRADPAKRVLFGQSRAGALILYSAFTKPDLFWARIASNPSWVPGQEIFYGEPAAATRKDLRLLIALGTNERADRLVEADKWFAQWRGRRSPWQMARIDIPGGTHSADSANAYRAAMRQLFLAN